MSCYYPPEHVVHPLIFAVRWFLLGSLTGSLVMVCGLAFAKKLR